MDSATVFSGNDQFEAVILPDSAEGVHNVSIRSERPVRFMKFGASGATLRSTVIPEISSELKFTAFNGPNPHLVAYVNEYNEDLLFEVGRAADADRSRFAHGINTSFVLPASTDGRDFYVRTFERGAGFTPSCASGAVASSAFLVMEGLAPLDEPIRIRNNGGPLTITIQGDEDNLFPTQAGNATYVYRTSVNIDSVLHGELRHASLDAFIEEMQAVDSLWWKNARHLESLGVDVSADA